MPLALIPRAHTTALAILHTLGMVLYVKVSLLFLSLRNFIMYVLLNVTKERAVLLVLLLLLLLLLSLLLIFNLNFYNIFRTPRNSRNELPIFFLFLFIYFLFLYYFQCNLIKLK